MNRRLFLFSSASVLIPGIAGCLTNELFQEVKKKDYQRYTETVDHILFSEDEKNIIFIAPDYHYIFDMPAGFLSVFNSSLRDKLTANIDSFYVDLESRITGKISLTLYSQNEKDLARTLGFTGTPYKYHFDLQGVRYNAEGFRMPANIMPLKKSYTVYVNEELSFFRKPKILLTPLTVAADGALALTYVAVVAGVVIVAVAVSPFALLYEVMRPKE